MAMWYLWGSSMDFDWNNNVCVMRSVVFLCYVIIIKFKKKTWGNWPLVTLKRLQQFWVLHGHICHPSAGPQFNIKITSYQYRKSHCGDKTILRLSYLHNGISYTGKTTSLYWIGALVPYIKTQAWPSLYLQMCPTVHINSMVPGKCGSIFKYVIFKQSVLIYI